MRVKVIDHGVRQIVRAPRGEHSCKPEQVAEGLGKLFGDVRRIELFARRPRTGWTMWGSQAPPTPHAVIH